VNTHSRWQVLVAAAILALTGTVTHAQPTPPSEPSTASLIEGACKSLRADPTIRARFPWAL